ncbi:MAG: hypothetical protein KKH75_04930, partial [Actinobacteria bacterium]|nr:hypothetical protein [Actinomycetota bacterium]
MRLEHWIDDNGGLVHRDAAAGAGFSREVQRRAVGEGRLRRVRRAWLATPSAPADLTAAAGSGTRVTCVSMARRRSWWLPEGIDDRLHLSVDPHGATPEVDSVRHWTARIAPAPVHLVIESFEDALGHIATCQPPETALVIWESAIRLERIAPEALRRVRWTSVAARECAEIYAGRCALIVRVTGASTSRNPSFDYHRQICSIEQAVSLGADAVIAMGFVGNDGEAASLTLLSEIAETCHRFGMPLIAEMLPAASDHFQDA